MKSDSKRIVIGADHAGFALKELLKTELEKQGYSVADIGTHSDASVDYPDFVHPAAEKISSGAADAGILLCGSGVGMCMAANRHPSIRASLAWSREIAELSRQHNNANVLCLPARYVSQTDALQMVAAFLNTPFEGGRHERRVEKIEIHSRT